MTFDNNPVVLLAVPLVLVLAVLVGIGISPWFRDHLKSTYATLIEVVHKDIITSAVKAGKFVQFRSSCTSDELHGIAIGYPGGQGIAWCTSRQGSETSTPKLKES